jgi:50S ribosomal subunit-associated GTPase HflX
VVVVVGNKVDLIDTQRVSESEARQWCEDRGLDFMPASAKTGSGVPEVFDRLLSRLAETRTDFGTRGVPKFTAPAELAPEEKGGCGC